MSNQLVRGKCPYCGLGIRFETPVLNIPGFTSDIKVAQLNWYIPREGYPGSASDSDDYLMLRAGSCPECKRISVVVNVQHAGSSYENYRLAWPHIKDGKYMRPVPTEVEDEHPFIAEDYREAASVLEISPKASAALSRRCLQSVLKEKAGASQRNLVEQIKSTIEKLPSYLGDQLDAIRNIGNFAAHPTKSQGTGEIVSVEPGEAEWNLDVLDLLFDFYYVQPRAAKARRDALT